ncbi:MAG: hypothetical protein K2O11_01135 [Oscillospiraceae bacterium]|nr:hypothetical protein [Oscillospiraceae bacterium]
MRRCCCGSQGQGGDLVAVAAALSVLMAQGKTAEQIELISTLFEIIGNNLSLLALKAPSEEGCCCQEEARAQDQNEGRCS